MNTYTKNLYIHICIHAYVYTQEHFLENNIFQCKCSICWNLAFLIDFFPPLENIRTVLLAAFG